MGRERPQLSSLPHGGCFWRKLACCCPQAGVPVQTGAHGAEIRCVSQGLVAMKYIRAMQTSWQSRPV